jgi:hypothetical protein
MYYACAVAREKIGRKAEGKLFCLKKNEATYDPFRQIWRRHLFGVLPSGSEAS